MRTLAQQFDELTLMKIFEVPVFDKRSNENTYIIFDISIDDNKFIAQHEAINKDELHSTKIAFCSIEIDEDFSLDANLQELYSECIQKIIDSEYFELQD